MKPVNVRHIAQTIERPAIRCSNEDIVVTCICEVGTEATESRHRNATGWISRITDIALKAGFIERSAGDLSLANQCDSGIGRPEGGWCKSKHSQPYTRYVSCVLLLSGKLVRHNSSNLGSGL